VCRRNFRLPWRGFPSDRSPALELSARGHRESVRQNQSGFIKCSARSGAAIYCGTICLDILSWDDPDRAQDSQAAVREAVSAFLIARKRPILRHRCRQSGVIGTIAPLIRRETAALVDPLRRTSLRQPSLPRRLPCSREGSRAARPINNSRFSIVGGQFATDSSFLALAACLGLAPENGHTRTTLGNRICWNSRQPLPHRTKPIRHCPVLTLS
jgi:hypothetical protein